MVPKGLADPPLKRDHTDKVHLDSRIELNGKINVAFSIGLAAGDGTEQREATNAGVAQLRLVRAQGSDHMLGEVDRCRRRAHTPTIAR